MFNVDFFFWFFNVVIYVPTHKSQVPYAKCTFVSIFVFTLELNMFFYLYKFRRQLQTQNSIYVYQCIFLERPETIFKYKQPKFVFNIMSLSPKSIFRFRFSDIPQRMFQVQRLQQRAWLHQLLRRTRQRHLLQRCAQITQSLNHMHTYKFPFDPFWYTNYQIINQCAEIMFNWFSIPRFSYIFTTWFQSGKILL